MYVYVMGHITCSILFLLQRTLYGHLQFLNPVFGEIHIKENPHFYEFFDGSIGTTSALYSNKKGLILKLVLCKCMNSDHPKRFELISTTKFYYLHYHTMGHVYRIARQKK